MSVACRWGVMLLLSVPLAGCGGGSGGAGGGETASVLLAGSAVKGIIVNGTVAAEEARSAGWVQVGSSSTDTNGQYTLSLGAAYTGGPVRITISDNPSNTATVMCDVQGGCGTFLFGAPMPLGGLTLQALHPGELAPGTPVSLQVTPLTHAASQVVTGRVQAEGVPLTAALVAEVNQVVGQVAGGIDILATRPVNLAEATVAEGAPTQELEYAYLVAAVAALAYAEPAYTVVGDPVASIRNALTTLVNTMSSGIVPVTDTGSATISTTDLFMAARSEALSSGDATTAENLGAIQPTTTITVIADADADGVADYRDHCAATPSGQAVDVNGCAASQMTCNDIKQGTVDSYDVINAACVFTPIPGYCNDGDPSTADAYVLATDTCTHTLIDADGDGVTDSVDQCPNTPSGEAVDANGCAASQMTCNDTKQGTADSYDVATAACVFTPIPGYCDDGDPSTADAYVLATDTCSNTLIDADGDGVSDSADRCPNTPAGEPVDVNGCAASQMTCNDNKKGTAGSYDITTASCVFTPIPGYCDDGDPSTADAYVQATDTCTHTLIDADGDGVSDLADQCPNTPAGEPVDVNGCAASQMTCNDAKQGTADSYDVSTATCVFTPIPGYCDDGDPNTMDAYVLSTDTCTHIPVVTDTTPPAVTAPANIRVTAPDASGVPVTDVTVQAFLSGASAVDAVDGVVAVWNDAPPLLRIGVHTITFMAMDQAQNIGTATAIITVVKPGLDRVLENPLPTPENIQAVASNGTRYVAVGSSGAILSSMDAATWTIHASGTLKLLHQIIWNGTLFVAVGEGGTILTSPDGATWTARDSGTTSRLSSIAWSGTGFVATGSISGGSLTSGVILTSADGVTWQSAQTPSPVTDGGADTLIWDGARFLITSLSGIWTSTDGAAWTAFPATGLGQPVSIAWNGSLYVAVYGGGSVQTSPDGTTWTSRTFGVSQDFTHVIWGGAQFVAVARSGSTRDSAIVTSPDGITWTIRTSGTTADLNGLAWNGTQYVAAGGAGTLLTSADGVSWTEVSSGPKHIMATVAWSGGQFFVGTSCSECGPVMRSADGITWTQSAVGTGDLRGVIWDGFQFVALADSGIGTAGVYTSPDGVTWTSRSLPMSGPFSALAWSGAMFVASGPDGLVMTSRDGIAWTPCNTGGNWTLNDVAWDGSQFVVVGHQSTILTSVDGITWTDHSLTDANASSRALTSLVSTGSQLVAGSSAGAIFTSPDGAIWTARSSGMTGPITGIAWSGTQFMAVANTGEWTGASGMVLTSPDAVNWAIPASPTTLVLHDITWDGTQFVAVGDNGIIERIR